MADYFDLLNARRSIRNYQDKEVSLETIMEIIKDGCLAPSSGNDSGSRLLWSKLMPSRLGLDLVWRDAFRPVGDLIEYVRFS
jgi:nitroreductase